MQIRLHQDVAVLSFFSLVTAFFWSLILQELLSCFAPKQWACFKRQLLRASCFVRTWLPTVVFVLLSLFMAWATAQIADEWLLYFLEVNMIQGLCISFLILWAVTSFLEIGTDPFWKTNWLDLVMLSLVKTACLALLLSLVVAMVLGAFGAFGS